jgi:glucose-1-phosphate adenylyltransferase
VIESNVVIDHCVLSPGVLVKKGSQIRNSVILTDATIEEYNSINKAIIDKHVFLGKNAQIGSPSKKRTRISMIGKNSVVPEGTILEDGGMIGCDVTPMDYNGNHIHFGDLVSSKGNDNGV